MQPKTLAATSFAPISAARFGSLALQMSAFVLATALFITLVAKVESVGYASDAVRPDPQSVFETISVSP